MTTVSTFPSIFFDGSGYDSHGLQVGLNDPSFASTFEQLQVFILNTITANPVGVAIVNNIISCPHTLMVGAPLQGPGQLPATYPWDNNAARPRTFLTNSNPSGGGGSDVTIVYDPTNMSAVDSSGHIMADDCLFHEMVHTLRAMLGITNTDPMVDFYSVDDFYAILMTNIYLSVANRDPDLRGNHNLPWVGLPIDSFTGLPIKDNTFYTQYSNMIDPLQGTMPGVYGPIASIPCDWNPIHVSWMSVNSPSNMFNQGGTPSYLQNLQI